MTDELLNQEAISSPTATGGAGSSFEQHVGAYFLSLLLVKAIPPIFTSSQITEVAFQTEYLNWKTDDLLVKSTTDTGVTKRLIAQVKRKLAVSKTDEEFKKVISDSWADWNSPQFSAAHDRFAFIVLRGTSTILHFLAGLFDLARNASDAEDFQRRMKRKGFVDSRVEKYYGIIAAIVGEVHGKSPDPTDLWRYLSTLYLLSMDLNTSTKQHEALVKSLLAFTSIDGGLATADVTWNELVTELTSGIAAPRCYRFEDLPETARARHSQIADSDKSALSSALDHTNIILNSIYSCFHDGTRIDRSPYWQKLIADLDDAQIVMVTGVAGSGKSAIAKDALSSLSREHFVFSFRAEEFAKPHLDEVLTNVQINVSSKRFSAILAGQSKKILLIESVERLLESSTRDAFADLLNLVSQDPTWQIVITCRKHSAEPIRSSFLSRLNHKMLDIPLLSDDELIVVGRNSPKAHKLFLNASLKELLRNPYYLSKTLQARWENFDTLPETEQALRGKLWREIVCAEDYTKDDMPTRRARTFISVAKERAQKLSLYVRSSEMDFQALAALRKDSLIVSAPNAHELVTPAHDVLEDWALLSWLDDIFKTSGPSISAFANAIGTYPALRRTYRTWVSELIDSDETNADSLFQDMSIVTSVPNYFFDDTLIGILRALKSVDFLRGHKTALLKDEKKLFHRIVSLLRVACRRLPDWVPASHDLASAFLLPEGDAWTAVLGFTSAELDSFDDKDVQTIVFLLKDWSRSVDVEHPYPDGSKYAADIIFSLLTDAHEQSPYNDRSVVEELTNILATIPLVDSARFTSLLQDSHRQQVSSSLRRRIVDGIFSTAACRDIPDEVIATAKDLFIKSRDDNAESRPRYRSELSNLFGFTVSRTDHSRASALQGPFLQVLTYHPEKGLDFIVSFVNDAVSRLLKNLPLAEQPDTVTLRFEGGESQTQFSGELLWFLYRGIIPDAPIMLESALMALEHWLIESAEKAPFQLDETLLDLLRHSNNVAITAVVASVATAATPLCIKTVNTLISSRTCIMLDRHRMARDAIGTYSLPGLAAQRNPASKLMADERNAANKRPHRVRELAVAIMMCQLGSSAELMQQILDDYVSQLPPLESQTDDDKTWRILLHCMDLRKHQQTPVLLPGDALQSESQKSWVLVNPSPPSPDLAQHIEDNTLRMRKINERLSIENWAKGAFNYSPEFNPSEWKSYLSKCRTISPDPPEEDLNIGRSALPMVAALSIRDHWLLMTPEEQSWCVQTMCREARRMSTTWDRAEIMTQRADSDQFAAEMLPGLLERDLSETDKELVELALLEAVAHPLPEVRLAVAAGLATLQSAPAQRVLAHAVNFWIAEATSILEAVRAQNSLPYAQRRFIEDIYRTVNEHLRKSFWKTVQDWFLDYERLDLGPTICSQNNLLILRALSARTSDKSTLVFRRCANTLVGWWDFAESNRAMYNRNIELENKMTELLAEYLLDSSLAHADSVVEPLLLAVDRHPSEISFFLMSLLVAQFRKPRDQQFWHLWSNFAARITQAPWISHLASSNAWGSDLIRSIFFVTRWEESRRRWEHLDGYEAVITNLFDLLPPSATVMDAYLYFLFHIGENALPQAFAQLSSAMKRSTSNLLTHVDAVFMLESLLRRYVYTRPLLLKQSPILLESVIFLLDRLVEQGSPVSYRIRDDFLTPLRTA